MLFFSNLHHDDATDTPVVWNMSPKTSFLNINYEHDLNEVIGDITEQIDTFESNGSGWIVDKFQTFELK